MSKNRNSTVLSVVHWTVLEIISRPYSVDEIVALTRCITAGHAKSCKIA